MGAQEPTWQRYEKDMKAWSFVDPTVFEHMKQYTQIFMGIHSFLMNLPLYKEKIQVPILCETWAMKMHGLALLWLRRFQLKVLTRASNMHAINTDVATWIDYLRTFLHNIHVAFTEALRQNATTQGWPQKSS